MIPPATALRLSPASIPTHFIPADRAVSAEAEGDNLMPFVRWMFYLFIFSVPLLQTLDVAEDTRLPKIVGYLFVLAALLQPRVCFRQSHPALWCFAAYIGVYTLLGAFQPAVFQDDILERLFSLIQLLAMTWITFNLMRHPGVARGALVALAVSGVLIALSQVTGVGATDYGAGKQGIAVRVSALGQNANRLAGTLAMTLIAVLSLAYGRVRPHTGLRFLVWSLLPLLGLSIVLTGSRGGLMALAGGLMVFMFIGNTIQSRLRNFVVGSIVLAIAILVSLLWEASRTRWEETLTAGKTAHRDQLFAASWEMFLESPIIGWGPQQNIYELGWRVRYDGWSDVTQPWRDTHNLIFWILTQVGLMGAIPFFAGIWLCILAAWKARLGAHGIFPLAFIVTLLMANQTGNWTYYKMHWLILAYVLASAEPILKAGRSCRFSGHVESKDVNQIPN
jgi:O-Antigen ligase